MQRFIEKHAVPEFHQHYLLYSDLKSLLKAIPTTSGSESVDPTTVKFLEFVESEFQKVCNFVQSKLEEVRSTLRYCYMRLLEMEERVMQKKADPYLDSHLGDLREQLDQACSDILNVEIFMRHNHEAICHLLHKHDRRFQATLFPVYYIKLRRSVLQTTRFDAFVLVISDLSYALSRLDSASRGGALAPAEQTWEPPSSFERATTKYLVRQDDVLKVKLIIVRRLPVLVFGAKQGISRQKLDKLDGVIDSAPISSVYLDTPDFYYYHSRIKREEGSKLLRVRWYGDATHPPNRVFFEQKTHHESWVDDASVKARFEAKSSKIGPFLAQRIGPEKFDSWTAKRIKAGEMKSSDGEDARKIIAQVAKEVRDHGPMPVVRTVYRRTAFQLTSSNSVRISLDTDMHFIREDGRVDTSGRWWSESGKDFLFPYAILEVKLQTSPADWVRELVESELITRCEKFSKFQHAIGTHYFDRVNSLPWWFGQKDLDGRSWLPAGYTLDSDMRVVGPAPEPESIDHMLSEMERKKGGKKEKEAELGAAASSDAAGTPLSDFGADKNGSIKGTAANHLTGKGGKSLFGDIDSDADSPHPFSKKKSTKANDGHASSDEEDSREFGRALAGANSRRVAGGGLGYTTENMEGFDGIVDGPSSSAAVGSGNKGGKLMAWWRSPGRYLRRVVGRGGREEEAEADGVKEEGGRKKQRTVISRPVKIEPKTFFACERTLLVWCSQAVMLNSISIAMFSLNNRVATVAGAIFTPIGCLFAVYALIVYHFRRQAIHRREPSKAYDDRFGPYILVPVLVIATFSIGLFALIDKFI